jgi:hypothetical protein
MLSAGLAQLLSSWEMAVYYLVMAVALALGVRLGVGRASEAPVSA